MPINPAIALGVQPLQLADPLSQYAKFASIQQAQQQNALAQYQLDAARREQASQNALNEAYRAAYDPQTGAIDMNRLRQTLSTGGFGSKLPGIEKSMAEVETKRAQEAKAKTDLVDAKLKQSRGFLDTINPADPNAPAQYIAWHEANHRDPVLGPVLAARGITADQSRARIAQAIQQGPQAFAELINQSKLGTEKFMEMNKPTTQVIDQSGQRQVIQLPGLGGAPTTVGTYADVPLPPDVEAQKARIAKESRAQTTIKLPEQEKAFETELGKGQAKKLLDDKAVAEDAASIIGTVQQGRQLLQSGMITGFGAEALTQIGAALNQAGISFAADSVANTQAFAANMAQNVGRIIKQFGAGTGLSNADREYAEKMAGGKITLDRKSIERILDINERAARNVISSYNKRASSVKTNVPLTIEMPAAAPPPAAPSERPSLQDIFQPKR